MINDIRDLLPRHPTKRWSRRTGRILYFCVHHSATSSDVTPSAMARHHIRRGFAGIAYHYVIGADGIIYQCNSDRDFTWHGHDFNSGLGICLTGNFTNESPTTEQLFSLNWLYSQKQVEHGKLQLVGHKEAPKAATACPGDTWPNWKDYIKENSMSKLGVHFQLYPSWHVNVINNARCQWVKFIDPTGPYPYSRPVNIIGRLWIGGDNLEQEFIDRRAAGAEEYFAMLLPRYRAAPWVTVWEGPNEPAPFWDRLQNLAIFTERWMQLMRQAGLRCAVGNFSVGQPQVHDLVTLFGPVIDKADYWALHEYSQPTMQTDANYLCLRYRSFVAGLRDRNFRIPPLLITECGIDGGAVTPQRIAEKRAARGWKTFATWPQYQSQLRWYAEEIAKDDYVLTATPFVSEAVREGNIPWYDFDLDEAKTAWVANLTLGAQAPLPDMELGRIMQAHVVPWNTTAAIARAAMARNMGLVPASDEVQIGDQIVQVFRTAGDLDTQHIAACRVGDWGNVRWWTRAN